MSNNNNDWLLRVGDGENFKNSSKYNIWGINTTTSPFGKHFVNNVKPGDRLWFIKGNSNGKAIAVATFVSHNLRELGPLINFTMTNEELGWTNNGPRWTSNVEVHYTDLYGLNDCELLTHIKGAASIRKYDKKTCSVNLAVEYSYIIKYSKVTFKL